MKDVIKWAVILTVLFAMLLGGSFLALTFMAPSPEELEELKQPDPPESSAEETQGDTLVISPLDSMQTLIDSLRSDIFFKELTNDSLAKALDIQSRLATTEASKVKGLEDRIEELTSLNMSVRDLAKTYETMKVSDMKPILDKVDDDTVIALYKNMGARTRKNLIQALSSIRAAQITKKIAGATS